MFAQSVTGVTEDPGLPGFAQALDSERMLRLLAPIAGLPPVDGRRLICVAKVLAHKLGRRCTLRYTVAPAPGEGQLDQRFTVIGKMYRRMKKAVRLHQRAMALQNGPFPDRGPLGIPAPLLLDERLGLVLQEDAEGEDLRHVLTAPDNDVAFSLAGRWLAILHATPPFEGLKTTSASHELEKVDQWCGHIAASRADAQELQTAQENLRRLGREMVPCEPVLIHKDFYFGNVLWDGTRLTVLDFDEMSVGDPALDVGHFLAHLETLAYRTAGRTDAFVRSADAFLASYRKESPFKVESRLPFYRAYTFLKLAAAEASRKREGWEQVVRTLTDLASPVSPC